MSWKKRRQFAYGRPDPKWARWSNLFTVISLAITLSGLYLYKLPIIGGLIALLWGISLVSTPWLILMGWASSLWNYGFPKFKEEPKENFMDLIKKESAKRKEERERQAKLNPFNRERAEKAAKEYHKQKGQFLEIVGKEKISKSSLKELKKIEKEKDQEWKKMYLNKEISYAKCNAFLKKELTPIRAKIKKIELQSIHEKASEDPDINLMAEESYDCHLSRLRMYGRSKWLGEYYYMGKRGGIYTLSENGSRNYKY